MSEAARYTSTRGGAAHVTFSEAVLTGLAPDGGLYAPTVWPRLEPEAFKDASLTGTAQTFLQPFLAGDVLAPALADIVREAYDFPVPVQALDKDGRLGVLELFHGPTAAFKDFGARFLAATMARIQRPDQRPLRILVATSGDTGGAVACALHGRPGIEVWVLFPKGLVSPTQERQLTCWGGNVRAFAVRGSFDDCQRLVKQAFADPQMAREVRLSSANSINLGRLLPQAVYYALSSMAVWRAYREPASYVIPSGNLGNAVACLWARRVGLPIDRIVLAHNSNRVVPEFLASGHWRPRPSIATLASAMDVGDPSNMERLRALYPEISTLRGVVSADTVDDDAIRARIRTGFERFGQIWCPHTAVAAEVYERLPEVQRKSGRWLLVATAHPAKFPEIVEPLIGRPVQVPSALEELRHRPVHSTDIGASLDALRAAGKVAA